MLLNYFIFIFIKPQCAVAHCDEYESFTLHTVHTSVENREIHCHAIFCRQIKVKFFSKKILSRNFCEEMVVKFRNLHTVLKKYFVRSTL